MGLMAYGGFPSGFVALRCREGRSIGPGGRHQVHLDVEVIPEAKRRQIRQTLEAYEAKRRDKPQQKHDGGIEQPYSSAGAAAERDMSRRALGDL